MFPIESSQLRSSASLAPVPETPRNSRRFSAYGLNILSEIDLPEFLPRSGNNLPADLVVSYDRSAEWNQPAGGERAIWSVSPRDARFWFPNVGGFRVRGGREILLSPKPDIEERFLRLYVEGMMMASVLQQRGYFVLHASVVQVRDYAVAFLGHIGAGKSSTAAALHMRGHAVVTDDNAAIDLSAPDLPVLPAFPTVKVFPKIATSLGYAEDSLQEMHSSQPKKARSVSRAFPDAPVPLKRLYVLTRDAEQHFAPLSRGEHTLEMIRNSVPTRWGQTGDANHLQQCARISSLIPAWRVRTFDTLEELPELARRIEEHCSEACGARA